MTRLLASLLAVVVLGGVATAADEPVDGARDHSPALRGAGPVNVPEVAGALRRAADADSAGAAAPHLAVAWQLLSGGPVLSSADPGDDTTLASHAALGDVDGDGSSDVLVVERPTYGGRAGAIRAIAGADGGHLWSHPTDTSTPATFRPLGVDLTGDGAPDAVSVTVESLGEERQPSDVGCPVGTCDGGGTLRRTATVVALVDGASGRTAWSRRYEGGLRIHGAVERVPAGPVTVVRYQQGNEHTVRAVLPLLGSDVDGDARPDLVVAQVDAAFENDGVGGQLPSGHAYATGLAYQGSVRLDLLSTGDGTVLARHDTGPLQGSVIPLPAGDITGDAAADVVILHEDRRLVGACSSASPCASLPAPRPYAVRAVDGRDLAAAWQHQSVNSYALDVDVLPDVDADGKQDLLVRGAVGPIGVTGLQEVLSGQQGRLLWGRPGFDLDVVSSGQLDLIEGTDLVAAVREPAGALALVRLRGRDGIELGRVTHAAAPDTYARAFTVEDVDGDGMSDVLLADLPGCCQDATTVLTLRSASTGGQLDRLELAVSGSWVRVVELDGRPGVDVLVEKGIGLAAVGFARRGVLWSSPEAARASAVVARMPDGSGDVDVRVGDGDHAVLVRLSHDAGVERWRYVA